MLLYIILCKTLLISMAYGSSDTLGAKNLANQTSSKSTLDSNNTTSTKRVFTVLTEGGAVISRVPEVIAPLDDPSLHAALILDKEYPVTNTKEGKITGRKGAPVILNNTESTNHTLPVNTNVITRNISNVEINVTKLIPVNSNITSTTVRPKPKILSYDELSKDIKSDKVFIVKSTSSGPAVLSQPINKQSLTDYSKHPGMVVPLVITVLVVPMFAVLGYMALKRGQEAWKNRHYKRMDFLLDGMYNE